MRFIALSLVCLNKCSMRLEEAGILLSDGVFCGYHLYRSKDDTGNLLFRSSIFLSIFFFFFCCFFQFFKKAVHASYHRGFCFSFMFCKFLPYLLVCRQVRVCLGLPCVPGWMILFIICNALLYPTCLIFCEINIITSCHFQLMLAWYISLLFMYFLLFTYWVFIFKVGFL